IRFIRTDLARPAVIRAIADQVVGTTLSTSLGTDGASIHTVEHLLAACAGLRVDNLLIEVDGPEIPILDGSAAPFVALLQQAGIRKQAKLQPYLRLIRPLQIGGPGAGVTLLPAPFPKINYTIDFSDAVIKRQHYLYHWTEEEFTRGIAPARTFGFMKDVERMRAKGLIKGASLENAVVVGDEGVMNPEGLRFPDEFVRHKVLDMIGDLALLGLPLVAQVEASCAGHAMNFEVVRALRAHPDAWVTVAPEPASPRHTEQPAPLVLTAPFSLPS
ncbi:MAG: UDP-3-O-[3-hydroxymyristoyl] N-acetylglucosamine deacetylase, partial [Nitrospirae bacterium]|nr:UDP-3-O-[3-hydroxymyristoyl] N-acetylglucosamine deacetylase [Nitrospirota bacterium]